MAEEIEDGNRWEEFQEDLDGILSKIGDLMEEYSDHRFAIAAYSAGDMALRGCSGKCQNEGYAILAYAAEDYRKTTEEGVEEENEKEITH